MPVSNTYKTINVKPLTGPLDTRSDPDAVQLGAWRRRINYDLTNQGLFCRSRGFQKLLGSASPYNNHDLHDQLCGDPGGNINLQEYYDDLAVPDPDASTVTTYPPPATRCGTIKKTRSTTRQPITMLFEAVSSDQDRKLLAATQNRIYAQNQNKGNWKIIADAYGGTPASGLPERRFKASQNGLYVFFTNGVDPVLTWSFDQVTTGCAMQAVSTIPDLAIIKLTAARCIFTWKGITFLGDVDQEGQRYAHRVRWCHPESPLEWDTATTGTLAGFEDLNYGERVMGFAALADYMIIVTDRAVWQVTILSDGSSSTVPLFNFRQLNTEPIAGDACIRYPNTLVSDGRFIHYFGRDGIYSFNLYMAKPEKLNWIDKADTIIFRGVEGEFGPINEAVCESHFGAYDAHSRSIWFSWVCTDSAFPIRTLRLWPDSEFVMEHDYGITAACNFTPDTSTTIREFLLQVATGKCICTADELASAEVTALLTESIKEGGYCSSAATKSCSGLSRNAPIFTSKTITVDGKIVEDYTQTDSSADSLCAAFGDKTLDDLCRRCDANQIFVIAYAENTTANLKDWSLKDVSANVYSRERTTSFTACGDWISEGYKNRLLTGPLQISLPDEEKACRKLEVEFGAAAQSIPSKLKLRFGWSANALDPNGAAGKCAIVWRELSAKNLECQSGATESEHGKDGTAPNRTLHWDFWFSGRNLYFELSTDGIGGSSCYSRIGLEVSALPRSTTK